MSEQINEWVNEGRVGALDTTLTIVCICWYDTWGREGKGGEVLEYMH